MTNSNENGVTEEQTRGELKLFDLPIEDIEFFKQLMRANGRRGNVAFRVLIDSYNTLVAIGDLHNRLTILENRVSELDSPRENKEESSDTKNYPRTFGMKKEG